MKFRELVYIVKKLTHKKNVQGLIRLVARIRSPTAVIAIVLGRKAAQLRLRFAGQTLLFREVDFGDFANIYEIFGKEIYRTDHEAATIVDLGAYRGFYAIYASAKYPEATIYALEPLPENYVKLRANTMLNALTPGRRLKLLNVAVSSESGAVDLFLAREGAMLHSIVHPSRDKLRVPATTVDGIMSEHDLRAIDILKIDVEGAEFAIFAAMDDATFARIGTIVAELHVVPGESIADLVDYLATKEFTLQSVDKTGLIYHFRRAA